MAITTDSPYRNEQTTLIRAIGANGQVKNLQLTDVAYNVKQTGTSGGLTVFNFGTITACSVTGTIAAPDSHAAGIVYSNFGTITACWFDGSISANTFGSIAALNWGGAITDCYWGGNAAVGVFENNAGSISETTKVNDGESWQAAIETMNSALADNEYLWSPGPDGLPELKKQ